MGVGENRHDHSGMRQMRRDFREAERGDRRILSPMCVSWKLLQRQLERGCGEWLQRKPFSCYQVRLSDANTSNVTITFTPQIWDSFLLFWMSTSVCGAYQMEPLLTLWSWMKMGLQKLMSKHQQIQSARFHWGFKKYCHFNFNFPMKRP